MNPRDHKIEIEVSEIEVCIDCSTAWDPCAESCSRPSDEVVERAVGELIDRHYGELVDLCADLHVEKQREVQACSLADRIELDRYYGRS